MVIPERENPFDLFHEWFEKAKKNKNIEEATAMSLATATTEAIPNVRMVLLKNIEKERFIFYTNRESQKGLELQSNPLAALCFYWPPLGKQVRVQGNVQPISDQEADLYFESRPRQSRIGAWASQQSRPIKNLWELKKNVIKYTVKFNLRKIPRPQYWSGFCIIPYKFEFWKEKAHRLHERLVYERNNDSWTKTRLSP